MKPPLTALTVLVACCMTQPAAAQPAMPSAPPATSPVPASPQPSDTGSAATTPTATPTLAPTPVPPASPPAPVRTPQPSPAATAPGLALPYVIAPPAPPAGYPAIVQIALNARSFRPGDGVFLRVTTSSDVTGVAIEAYGQRFPLTATGSGRFVLSGTIPSVPFFFLNRNYSLDCVATGAAGRTTRVPFQLYLSA